MGKQIAELYAVISGDTSKLEASLKSSKAGLTGLSDQTKKTQSTMGNFTKGLDSTVQGLTGFSVAQLTVAGAVGAFVVGAKKAIDAASNMEETTSKVGVVFGKSAEEVRKFGTGAATSLGMSKQAALDAAGTFGNLFVSMGMGKQASADMSTRLVQLAGDLASFNNIDTGEALEKLRAGIVGEAEPLRALGVNLTEADVKARAMALGLGAAGRELTAAEKAQARYALILEQTITAQGDFARTSDGAANQMRILGAELENIKAIAGKTLLPGYAAELREITGSLKIYSQNLEDLQSHSKNIFQILRENQTAYAALDAQLKMATGQQWDWNDAQREGLRVGKMIPGAVEEAKIAVEDTFVAVAAGGEFWQEYAHKQGNAAKQMAVETRNYNQAVAESVNMQDKLTEAGSRLADAQANFNKTYGGEAKSSLDKYGVSGQKLVDAYGAMDEKLGTTYKAQYENEKKMDDLARAYARGKISAKEYADGLEAQKGSWADLDDNLKNAKLGFENAQTAWNNFIQSIGAANGQHFSVTVDVNTSSNTGGKVNTRGGTSYVSKDEKGPGRQTGGAVTAGNYYTVGEAGWETFVPTTNGFMISHQEAVDILRGNRSPVTTTEASQVNVIDKARPYNLYFTSTKSDAREVAREVVRLMINRS